MFMCGHVTTKQERPVENLADTKCGLKASRSAKPAPHEPNPGDLDYLGWILIQIILSL